MKLTIIMLALLTGCAGETGSDVDDNECKKDSDCDDRLDTPYCVESTCVGCRTSDDCDDGRDPFCWPVDDGGRECGF